MNDISYGEIMAQMDSAQRHRYIEKSKWDNIQMKSIDNDFAELDKWLLDDESKKHKARNMTITGCSISSSYDNPDNLTSNDVKPQHRYTIWNLWINVNIVNFSEFFDMIIDSKIEIHGGGSLITEMSMIHNLFIAKLMGKELIENHDSVDIPIISLEMLIPNGFPLYLLGYHDVCIILVYENRIMRINTITFDYEESRSDGIGREFICMTCASIAAMVRSDSTVINPRLNHPSKMLLFEFFGYKVDEPILESITLYLCGFPIEYHIDDGTIICSEFNGRKIYGLSLTHEFRTEDDMIKFFCSKRPYRMLGINFSRVDNLTIKFKFDREYDGLIVGISNIHSNRLRFMSGMLGLAYSN